MTAFGMWKQENPAEHYPTPANATEALLRHERFQGLIWECACGNGAISRLLPGEVLSSDLFDYGYGKTGIDFLKEKIAVPNIVTNPPYSLKIPFIYHALRCATAKVAMLLEVRFLQGVEASKLFRRFPPHTLYVLRRRLTFGDGPSSQWGHVWYVWHIGWQGETTVQWVDN